MIIKYILSLIILIVATISCLGCYVQEPRAEYAYYCVPRTSGVLSCSQCGNKIYPSSGWGHIDGWYWYRDYQLYDQNRKPYTVSLPYSGDVVITNTWCVSCNKITSYKFYYTIEILSFFPNIPPNINLEIKDVDVKIINGKKYTSKIKIYTKNNQLIKQLITTNMSDGTTQIKTQSYDNATHGVWNKNIYPITAYQSTPINIRKQFVDLEEEKVQRLCLLYLDKNGYWKILKDIKNPPQYLFKQNGYALQPFGKNVIKHSYGYKVGEILNLLIYYKTKNYETHNLEELLKTKISDPTIIESVISFGITQNIRPQ